MAAPTNSPLVALDDNATETSARETIRACRVEDLLAVLNLQRELYPEITAAEMAEKERRLRNRMMNTPWKSEGINSLVYESDGRIAGFLGMDPRSMRYRDETIDVALSYSFMVHPDHRSGLGALNLMKTFVSGPQDLSIADSANDLSRRIWERLGGVTLPMRSMYWKHIVRPAGFAAHYLQKKKGIGGLVKLARPLVRAVDQAVDYFQGKPADSGREGVRIRELTPELLADCIKSHSADKLLSPDYEAQNLEWLLNLASSVKEFGDLRKEYVTDRRDNILGWMIYYSKPGGANEVLQLKAFPGKEDRVVAALFAQARQQGCVEVSGRLDPEMTVALAEYRCLYLSSMWMLVHTRNEGIRNAILNDNLFLSRLEGDLWLI